MGRSMLLRAQVIALVAVVAGAVLVAAPAQAAQTDIRVITHNVRGGQINRGDLDVLDLVKRQISSYHPDVVMLQEVCESQAANFAAKYPSSQGWTVHFSPRRGHDGCNGTLRDGIYPQIGELIATPRNGASGLWAPELASEDPAKTRYHVSCLTFKKNGGQEYLACTTHLSAGGSANAAVRAQQLDRIRTELDWSIGHGRGVIFGGDLNVLPGNASMNKIYKIKNDGTQNGAGPMFEADQGDKKYFGSTCGERKPFCQTGQPTKGKEDKFDYVFFSANNTRPNGQYLTAEVAGKGLSNHNLVRAEARFFW